MTLAAAALLIGLSAPAWAQNNGGGHGRGHHGQGLQAADANGDGAITREEARAARAEGFARMDTDGDGFITDADRQVRAEARRARHAERRAAAHTARDADGDGRISQAEFANAPMPYFDRLDANSNGVLDASELEAARSMMRERRGRRGAPAQE